MHAEKCAPKMRRRHENIIERISARGKNTVLLLVYCETREPIWKIIVNRWKACSINWLREVVLVIRELQRTRN